MIDSPDASPQVGQIGRSRFSAILEFPHRHPRRFDFAVISVFAIIATLFHLGRHPGGAITDLDSDAANIASFAAALDHPDLFTGDEALGRVENFRFYATIHIPLIRALQRATGDYGSAMTAMIGPHVFLHLVGFYLFGSLLLKSRVWALLLSFAMLSRIYLTLTIWGVYPDPIPRFGFSAVAGFIFSAAFWAIRRPKAWPWIMALVGLTMYIHPVSAPTFALGIWVGLWTQRPQGWTRLRQTSYLVFCGLCFLAVSGPFILNYLAHHDHGQTGDPALIREMMNYRFARGFMSDQIWGIMDTLRILCFKVPILPLALAGVVALVKLGGESEHRRLRLVGLWTLGVLASSVGLFLLDHAICQWTGRIPMQIDLVRGIRFLVPLSLTVWALALAALRGERLSSRMEMIRKLSVGAFAAFILLSSPTYMGVVGKGIERLFSSPPSSPPSAEWLAALETHTQPGDRIFAFGVDELAVRYAALRPVVFSEKDGGVLAYANLEALSQWYDTARMLDGIEAQPDDASRDGLIVLSARTLDAAYILTNNIRMNGDLAPFGCRLVWSNTTHRLLAIVRPNGNGEIQ